MKIKLSHPEWLTLSNEEEYFFGGDQVWYSTQWKKDAGCGPTCGANLVTYLSQSNHLLSPLASDNPLDLDHYIALMETLFEYITPGKMGVYKPEMFVDGMVKYAKKRGIILIPHVFKVSRNPKKRPDVETLKKFLIDGFSQDTPIAFLNLSKGQVKELQSWHWITLTGIQNESDQELLVEASDEGKQIVFDLRRWYDTTKLSGGLVYFTMGEG